MSMIRLIRNLVRLGWSDFAIRSLLNTVPRERIDREIKDARAQAMDGRERSQ